MVKRLVALFSLIAIFTSILSPANAVLKEGGSCTKKGQIKLYSGKTYVCLKIGKKLIWNLREKKVQYNQKPFVPWSTPENYAQEFDAFQKNISSWFSARTSNKINLNIYVDSAYFPEEIPWITKALNFQAQLLGVPEPASYKVYISKKDSWIIEKRKSVTPGLESWNPKFICYEDVNQGCAYPNLREMFFVWNASSLESPHGDWQFTRSLSHEFFHISQCDLMGDSNKCGEYFNKLPSWLAEGGPNVIGAIFMNKLKNLDYLDQRRKALNIYSNGKNGAFNPLSDFTKNVRFGELFPYEIGMIACEYLIASAGLQSFFDFYANLAKYPSFEEAFQKSFGIKLEDFYSAFDKARSKLDFYAVKN